MNLKWSTYDLQKKAVILACSCIVFWVFILGLVFLEVRGMKQTTMNLEVIQDLYDAILEMRRYEKNFLLYKGDANLEQTLAFYATAHRIYDRIDWSVRVSDASAARFTELGRHFNAYQAAVLQLKRADNSVFWVNQEKIRVSGAKLIDLVKQLSMDSRRHVAASTKKAVWLPLTAAALVIGLFFAGIAAINRRLVQPLVLLERAAAHIGQGDFRPIHYPGPVENEVERLVFAFNQMTEELDARQEQIIHARKIASLGTLVSGVAHELNNPINNIILTADSLVAKPAITDARKQDMLNDILDQAVRAGNIVKNLLDFSRAQVPVMETVDVEDLLNDIFKLTENELALKKIILEKYIQPGLSEVKGNHQALQQVFINLVTNAVHAMGEHGQLTVQAVSDDKACVAVTVKDTGQGIHKKDLPRIFDPFFTTKAAGQGTGLGLSVSYGIIKKHKGQITVDSERGVGTTFCVSLPSQTPPKKVS